MGRKPATDERPSGKAAKPKDAASASAKDGKKQRMSVSALLASMDQKPKGSAAAASKKPKPKSKPGVSSYTDDIDLPPSDEEEEVGSDGEVRGPRGSASRSGAGKPVAELSVGPSNKELKKREKKEHIAVQDAEIAKQEALKDDRDAFTVVVASRVTAVDDGEDCASAADANVKDITVENFSVSARGKELLKNATVKTSLLWKL